MTEADNKQFKWDNRLYDTDYTLFYLSRIRRLKYDYDEQYFILKITIKDRTKNFFAQLGPLAYPTIHLRINIEKILMGRK